MKVTISYKLSLVLLFLCSVLIFSSCKKEGIQNSKEQPAQLQSKSIAYKLVWSDEFNGTTINTSNWTFDKGGGGWGNNEKEYYTTSNAMVTNGKLIISARKQTFMGYNYTSTRMKTQGKREFTYGKIEANIKMPMGQGLWPAFWMLGANINTVGWPKCGEIDIMEHVNANNLIYGTMHWETNGYAYYGGNTTSTPELYHVYSVEWNAEGIKWFVDGVQYHIANTTNNINGTEEFHKPFFIILNLAVGGNFPGQTIDDSKFPAKMYVDYVRVFQAL